MPKAIKPKPPKLKCCPICSTEYTPRSSLQKVCHNYRCAIAFNRQVDERNAAREIRKQERLQRADLRQRKEALKTKAQWQREAQTAFNKFVRMRDLGLNCISCGRLPEQRFGGTMDCGHFRTRGAAKHLSFNLFNTAAQCVYCNRNQSGAQKAFEDGLVKKLGRERVDAILNDNAPRKFTIEYLQRVKAIFTRRARHYEKLRKRQQEAA